MAEQKTKSPAATATKSSAVPAASFIEECQQRVESICQELLDDRPTAAFFKADQLRQFLRYEKSRQ